MVETSGEWREERLWVHKELERLSVAVEQKAAELAVHEDREEKQKTDINQAHAKIRSLEAGKRQAQLKLWISSGAASGLMVLVIELVKMLLAKK
jgi:hypothetical protein